MNRFLLSVCCLLSCMLTSAQTVQKEIEASIESLNQAMISRDKSMLEKLTAVELSYGHSTGLVEDKPAFEQDILTGSVRFFTIDYTDQSIQIADDVAIVRNISAIKGSKDGAPLDLKIGILMIWQKRGDHWKLLARQGFKLP
jgi:ketosteroid isomerase-like protein